MVSPMLRRPPLSRSWTPRSAAPSRRDDDADDRVDAFSAGCALSVVGLLYAAFLVRAGGEPERLAIAFTAVAIGAALLVRCFLRRVRR